MSRRRRPAPARRDSADSDARRRLEATTLYDALTVCQTRAHAITLIDRALLLARIAGSNAYIIETSRRARVRAEAQRRSARAR